jgi:hypothetical protein
MGSVAEDTARDQVMLIEDGQRLGMRLAVNIPEGAVFDVFKSISDFTKRWKEGCHTSRQSHRNGKLGWDAPQHVDSTSQRDAHQLREPQRSEKTLASFDERLGPIGQRSENADAERVSSVEPSRGSEEEAEESRVRWRSENKPRPQRVSDGGVSVGSGLVSPVEIPKEDLHTPRGKVQLFACVRVERYRLARVLLAVGKGSTKDPGAVASGGYDSNADQGIVGAYLWRQADC